MRVSERNKPFSMSKAVGLSTGCGQMPRDKIHFFKKRRGKSYSSVASFKSSATMHKVSKVTESVCEAGVDW